MPRALLAYPQNPVTFWSFDEALKIANKSSAFPSLGLLTVAAMLPAEYELKHVDLNVEPLRDKDVEWADIVLTSSMIIHWHSLEQIIARCNKIGTPVLNGGPLPTQYSKEIKGNAVFFLGEAENGFLDTVEQMIEAGANVERGYVDHRGEFNKLAVTPKPRWDLIDFKHYSSVVVQFTRGCPESCTFCNIPALYGKTTRIRDKQQTLDEFQALYDAGWRGAVMAVDDNFVGNSKAICELLEEGFIEWQETHGHPFSLSTQLSLRVADDPRLLEAMRLGGFDKLFCGIESPSEESLAFMGAQKNLQGGTSLIEKVNILQSYGFEIMAGFILGLDTDPDDIADRMIDFIQDAGIPVSMVGILGVLPDTPDFKRFGRQNRLVESATYTGDSGLFNRSLSFVPVVEPDELFARHRKVIETINTPEKYFERSLRLYANQKQPTTFGTRFRLSMLTSMARAVWTQGVRSSYRKQYWKFLGDVWRDHRRHFGNAIRLAVSGHHLFVTTQRALEVDDVFLFFQDTLRDVRAYAEGCARPFQQGDPANVTAWRGALGPSADASPDRHRLGSALIQAAESRCELLGEVHRRQLNETLTQFRDEVRELLAPVPAA